MHESKVAPAQHSSDQYPISSSIGHAGKHILNSHSRCSLRLMRVTEYGIGYEKLFFRHNVSFQLISAEQGYKHACRDSRADNSRNVRTHGMHEKEVRGVLFLTYDL